NEAGTRYGRDRLRFLMERMVMKQKYRDAPDLFRASSPLLRLDTMAADDIPPFFVIHGRNDSLVPVTEARAFVEKLHRVSRRLVAYAELPGTQHAFEIFGSVRAAHVSFGTERFLVAMHSRARMM